MMLCIGLVIYAILLKTNAAATTKIVWFKMSQTDREIFETNNACCGFNSAAESTNCPYSASCAEFFTKRANQIVMLGMIAAGVGAGMQIFAVLVICKFFSQLRAQKSRQRKKEARRAYKLQNYPKAINDGIKYGSRFSAEDATMVV